MQKISIYIALSLIMLMMGTSSAFAFSLGAAEDAPPSITYDFEDEEDNTPPSLSMPGSSGSPNGAKPPTIPSINSTENPPKITYSFDPAATATLVTNNASTNISKTGPETNYLIIASLILGYFISRRFKKPLTDKYK